MSSSSLLKLSSHRAAGKPERLLRAAVTTFCSIPRPSRRETSQLDDLAVPLLERVSDDTLRFTAAALSDSPFAPPILIRRLCDQSIDICAPILMRSPVLTNIDLLALIGRHGLPHARAIAARAQLDPRIVRLIASIGAFENEPAPVKVEQVRDRLRAMMLPGEELRQPQAEPRVTLHWQGTPDAYLKLRSTALAGVPALFHTALADSLDVPMDRARAIADGSDVSVLIVALRALDLTEEQAFLVFQCVWPSRTGDARSVRGFIDAWQAVSKEQAETIVANWREPLRVPHSANQAGRPDNLRAS
ncbi:hypothetical protein [Mesorhizobium sp. CAU 1741]|uniref:hypothetical protein n=1 Tax=Mesorhizobium sp. CAU 1741 TaxID=3140366 RepID=UPI00325BBB28